MARNDPKVSIVIPTRDRPTDLRQLIESIVCSDFPMKLVEIIVIAESPLHFDVHVPIRTILTPPDTLVSDKRNRGIGNATGELILLIDDDNVVDRTAIRILVEAIGSMRDVAVVAPIMYHFSKPRMVWCAGIRRSRITSRTHYIGNGQIDIGQFPKFIESEDFPNCMMTRSEVLRKVGAYDTRHFPITYEEADVCLRIRKSGYRVLCITESRIWHKTNPHRLFGATSSKRVYLTGRNRVLFHRMHTKPLEYAIFATVFLPIVTAYYLLQILRSRYQARKRIAYALTYLHGVMDGTRSLTDRIPVTE